jgi:hypothetical protein
MRSTFLKIQGIDCTVFPHNWLVAMCHVPVDLFTKQVYDVDNAVAVVLLYLLDLEQFAW